MFVYTLGQGCNCMGNIMYILVIFANFSKRFHDHTSMSDLVAEQTLI